MKKIVPLITCDIPFCQYVCELVFGVDVLDLNLRIQINSVKLPVKSNSVGSGHVSHFWTSAFDDHFNQCFVVLKKCTASHRIEKTSRSTKHSQHCSDQDCRAGLEPWFGFGCASLMWYHATSFLVLDLWFCLIGSEKNETFLSPNPKDQELEFHRFVNQH